MSIHKSTTHNTNANKSTNMIKSANYMPMKSIITCITNKNKAIKGITAMVTISIDDK